MAEVVRAILHPQDRAQGMQKAVQELAAADKYVMCVLRG